MTNTMTDRFALTDILLATLMGDEFHGYIVGDNAYERSRIAAVASRLADGDSEAARAIASGELDAHHAAA